MRVGDVLEWLAAVCLVLGAYLGSGRLWPALLVAAVCLLYEAQCLAQMPLPRRRRGGDDQ